MTTHDVFLDESGDVGWSLDKPYRKGGSSRFIVLGAIALPHGKNKSLQRIVRDLYRHRNGRELRSELKSTALNGHERQQVADRLLQLVKKDPDISLHAIVAEKAVVNFALRERCESFYVHMAEQLLHPLLARHDIVDFYPDARSIKEKDRYALHNYLETRLAIAGHVPEICTVPSDSRSMAEIQCADILCSMIWAHFEYGAAEPFNTLAPAIKLTLLYMRPTPTAQSDTAI
ncbi:DUF3800 domain-containing protein [Amantichitinum ursilacus]|uniref:DUF3800 domain-containing protein n=1 Tax=Amantichitinum ursilacus TaxID=857265 RepID=A0A0N0GPY6_9NEIS|nr:DUF3800 domain-containing protein [Amantichitinum ursilacus]KPC54234.1 hypothetical protein WG78_06280 [Amantichitinum ursilacus]